LSTITIGRLPRRRRRAPDVYHRHGRVGGRLEEHDAHVVRRAYGRVEVRATACRDADALDAELTQVVVDQVHAAAIERLAVDDGVARPQERHERGHGGGHSGVEHQRRFRSTLERDDLLFEDLGVRMRDARVDQLDVLAR
jgi:hypothetical protein